jgi:O-antigen ligase
LGLLRPRLNAADLAAPIVGGALTLFAAYAAVRVGAEVSVGGLLVVGVFVAAMIGFAAYPHIAVAATVVLFALVPMLKVVVWPEIGAVKDLVVLAAGSAAVLLFVFERRQPDRWVLLLVLILLGLYVVNAGGGHDIAWAQGVRLIGEPLLLLLVGLTLPDPRRTFRYAMVALIATACLVATYGVVQQQIGDYGLNALGYEFDTHIQTLPSGLLRSFGTLDDPFAYAALLLFGLAAVVFWLQRTPVAWCAALLLLLGLGLSFVRTALVILVAFVGLLLGRWGYTASAILVVAATVVAGAGILANAGGSESRSYAVGSGAATASGSTANVVLNGRISAWEAALGPDASEWVFGRGVGEVGTAAARATYTIVDSGDEEGSTGTAGSDEAEAVDSGYLATIAEVGFVGLVVMLALFGRLIALAIGAVRQRTAAGWVALALLAALLLDALTRASFTGFPTAFLGLLLVGVALAAAREEAEEGGRSSPAGA